LTYERIRKDTKLFSQLIQTCRREVWIRRKKIKNGFVRLSPKFENRGFKTFFTKRGTFCIRFTIFKNVRIVIPLSMDRQFQRFFSFLNDGWNFKTIQIVDKRINITLIKEFPETQIKQRIVGVDIGSVNLATITVYDSVEKNILKQLYLGRDLAVRQRKFIKRRAKLQSGNNRKYLQRFRRKQRNFVKTRSEQVAWEVVKIAKQFNGMIAIENIRNLRSRNKGRKVNGIINRIPYGYFFKSLGNICIRELIKIIRVEAKHTSQGCPICNTIDRRNLKGRIFKCIKCGRIVNRDRNASLNISLSAIQIAFQPNLSGQITQGRVRVNEPSCPNEVLIGCL
jgi:IS605 OrfB family transposase